MNCYYSKHKTLNKYSFINWVWIFIIDTRIKKNKTILCSQNRHIYIDWNVNINGIETANKHIVLLNVSLFEFLYQVYIFKNKK